MTKWERLCKKFDENNAIRDAFYHFETCRRIDEPETLLWPFIYVLEDHYGRSVEGSFDIVCLINSISGTFAYHRMKTGDATLDIPGEYERLMLLPPIKLNLQLTNFEMDQTFVDLRFRECVYYLLVIAVLNWAYSWIKLMFWRWFIWYAPSTGERLTLQQLTKAQQIVQILAGYEKKAIHETKRWMKELQSFSNDTVCCNRPIHMLNWSP